VSKRGNYVMTEHAAWLPTDCGWRRVFAMSMDEQWLVRVDGGSVTVDALTNGSGGPEWDSFALPADTMTEIPDLTAAVAALGIVTRFRNADLWDALGTAVIRQVIRAGQSKKLYRVFCAAYGERVELPGGETYALFPSPEIVLRLSDEQFNSVGMAFKRRTLKAAADAYLRSGQTWQGLPAERLIDAVQLVPRIGPWTARAAVADWSNDWSLYPYSDLAVRTWAGRAAPTYDWPADETAFGRVWRALAGEHLSSLTLLTLAWGSQHGDIG
jgi:DNA-3-methyladenine glycosylase II